MAKRAIALMVLALVVVGSFVTYQLYYAPGAATCRPLAGGSVMKTNTQRTAFGAVTEYKFPGQDRWPNAVTTAPDGSVWFAEQEVPGVGHLFPNNGTVVEYAWPGYPTPKLPDCIPSVSASGIALWNGRVWAADEFGNSIVGINPGDDTARSVNTTGKAAFPYWLAAGPDGALWFTSDTTPARLGRIQTDMSMNVVSLVGLGSDEPLQLEFVNSSLAYLATINLSSDPTTHACVCNGHVYAFDPRGVSSTLTPERVGGDYPLQLPTSVSYSRGSVWVAQHGAASVLRYDFSAEAWTAYPTSIVGWTSTTLPLQIQTGGNKVWFNEHYANKIAFLDPSAGTLTEYSESNPPASDAKGIQNDLSIAASANGLWFTSMSGNYIGFVDASRDPGLHVNVAGTNGGTLAPGESASFALKVTGTWASPMKVNVSDSESASIPKSFRIVPSALLIQPGVSSYDLNVMVATSPTARQGSYTLAVTVTNGIVQQTAYIFITVK